MNALLLTLHEPSPGILDWVKTQPGEWTVKTYDAYVDHMAQMSDIVSKALDALDVDIASYERVVFVPPGLSVAVIPFFEALYDRCLVVPEQLNTIRGPGGQYIPCPEAPIFHPALV